MLEWMACCVMISWEGAYVFIMGGTCGLVVGSVEGSGYRWVYIGGMGVTTL